MYTYAYPRPAITTDCVIFSEYGKILLIERGGEPYKGKLALPGGFVNIDEKAIDAAYRELKEETSIEEHDILARGGLEFFNYYDNPNRDERTRVISFAFVGMVDSSTNIKAGDDAAKVGWYDTKYITNHDLAFDHYQIIDDAKTYMGLT